MSKASCVLFNSIIWLSAELGGFPPTANSIKDVNFLTNFLSVSHQLIQDLLVPVTSLVFFISHPDSSHSILFCLGLLFVKVQVSMLSVSEQ
jgi:hypothetical protein